MTRKWYYLVPLILTAACSRNDTRTVAAAQPAAPEVAPVPAAPSPDMAAAPVIDVVNRSSAAPLIPTGTVLRVGNWVARKRTVLLDPGEVNDVRTVECVIALDGSPDGLLVGQRMRVRIGKAE